jgi:hypothetical protein
MSDYVLFQQYFSYNIADSIIGEGKPSIQRKKPTSHKKSLKIWKG